MKKKQFLADILFNKLSYICQPIFMKLKSEYLRILAYHRIYPKSDNNYFYDKNIISATPEMFDKQLKFIKNKFEVINFYTLNNMLSMNKKIPSNALIITFDDGYADNYDIASKILSAYHMTAVFFITTNYIDNNEPFWFEKLAYQIKRTEKTSLELLNSRYQIPIESENKEVVLYRITKILSESDDLQRIKILSEIDEQSGVKLTELDSIKILSWKQIKQMSHQGFEIGSHTVNHPFLTRVNDEALNYELQISKHKIEEKIGRNIITIAYPFGDVNKKVIKAAKESEYLFGCSYRHAVSMLNPLNPYEIPRIHIETDVDFSLFKSYMLFPKLFVNFRN